MERTEKKFDYDPHFDPVLKWTPVDLPGKGDRQAIPAREFHPIRDWKQKTEHTSSDGVKVIDYDWGRELKIATWLNKLIAGAPDTILKNLIDRGFGSKIQTIFLDAIEMETQVQASLKTRRDKECSSEEKLKIFLQLFKETVNAALRLLTREGSIFVSATLPRVHYLRLILDDVFQAENFISIISYKTECTGDIMDPSFNMLIWYARELVDKQKKIGLKFRPFFIEKVDDLKSLNSYGMVDLGNKKRGLTKEEKKDPSRIPSGGRRFKTISLHSQHYSPRRTVPFTYNGKTVTPPPNRQWCTSVPEGLRKIADAGRIYDAGKTFLFIYYLDDYPIKPISNMWGDTLTIKNGQPAVKFETIVERIINMTSAPGDIVLVPVDSSGNIGLICEKWGRRWIVCDQSRAILDVETGALRKATFNYYFLKYGARNKPDFECHQYNHVTANTFAEDAKKNQEIAYNQPIKDPKITRVAGPFSLEVLQEEIKLVNLNARDEEKQFRDHVGIIDRFTNRVFSHLKNTEILVDDHPLKVKDLRLFFKNFIHARAIDEATSQQVVFSINPEFTPDFVDQAVFTALHYQFEKIVFIAVDYKEGAEYRIQSFETITDKITCKIGKIASQKIAVKNDPAAHREDLMYYSRSKFNLHYDEKMKKYFVEFHGIHHYDPRRGTIISVEPNKAEIWMLDLEYNGDNFSPHQILFTNQEALKANLERKFLECDLSTYKVGITLRSFPFDMPKNGLIGVKVIDNFNNELLEIIEVNSTAARGKTYGSQ